MSDTVETLRQWGRELAKIAAQEITYSDSPTCGMEVLGPTKCNQNEWHHHYCDKPATQFEHETTDSGSQMWLLRCEEHAINEKWCPSVPLEPPA